MFEIANEVIDEEEQMMVLGAKPPTCSPKKRGNDDSQYDKGTKRSRTDDKKKDVGSVSSKDTTARGRGDNRYDSRPREEGKPVFTLLNASRSTILSEIKDRDFFRWPDRMNPATANKRDRSKYCEFHRDYGHETDQCGHLKREIELLIQRGNLSQYVRGKDASAQQAEAPTAAPRQADPGAPKNIIYIITGGLAAGGSTVAGQKSYARQHAEEDLPRKRKASLNNMITFSDQDLEGIHTPHDDALVITADVNNHTITRMMVDSGSAVDVLFYSAFEKMGISAKELRPVSELFGFTGNPVKPEGVIVLPMTVGDPPTKRTIQVSFIVIQAQSAHNAILGRPSLLLLQAVPSTFHLMLKFPTPRGIASVRGDQVMATTC